MDTSVNKSTRRSPSKSRNTSDAVVAAGAVSASVAAVLQTLIRWGGSAVIAYFAFRSIAVLAGRETSANIILNFLSNIGVSSSLNWMVGVGGVAYGLNQKRLRSQNIERLSKLNKALQEPIDPNRTSSHLTVRGDTNPEDRI